MAFEVVKELECITNVNSEGELVDLTVGELYESIYVNSTPNSKCFGVFCDEGLLTEFDSRYFKVVSTQKRENIGWQIQCRDCFKEVSLEDIIKSNKCPSCGQQFIK